MNKKYSKLNKREDRLVYSLIVLLCLAGISMCAVGSTYAKYVTEGSASDEARVAVWAVTADLSEEDVTFTADDKYGTAAGSYYMFTITPGNTEVKSKYGINISLSKEGEAISWPEKLTAQIRDEEGNILKDDEGNPIESNDGTFSDLGVFEPGASEAVTYRLYFKADYDINCGQYDMEVTAKIEQVV